MITLQDGNPALWAKVVAAGQEAAARNLPPVWAVADQISDESGIIWQNTTPGDPGLWFRLIDLQAVGGEQPLDADLSAIAALPTSEFGRSLLTPASAAAARALLVAANIPAGIVDGQLMAWSASLGLFVPVSPTGNGELAYAENITFTATTLAGTSTATGTAVDIPGCSISVPISARPVWLEGTFAFTQTALGQGQAVALIVETTAGAGGTSWSDFVPLPNNTGPRSQNNRVRCRFRLGASTSQIRTFKLQGRCDATGATVPSVNALNSAISPTYLTALAA